MVKNISELKKILIIRLSSLGDILLTTPLIRSIRNQNPSAQIDFVIKEEFFEVLEQNPYLTTIYKYSKTSSEKNKLIDTLKSNNYENVIDLQNNNRSREITRQLQSKVFRFRKNNFKKFLLVHFKINKMKHLPQIPIRYAEATGISLDNEGLDLFTEKTADPKLDSNKKYIGLCPGAKHFTKRWPKEYFIELGKMLESDGYNIVLFGGPDEMKITDEISNELSNPLNLCNESILQTAANMKMCKLIYTNDSGTMHMASAMKVPVIAFFGSTVKEFGFYPFKSENIVLENKNLSCRPCTHIGRSSCPKIHFKCMKEISPELAFNSLTKLQLN